MLSRRGVLVSVVIAVAVVAIGSCAVLGVYRAKYYTSLRQYYTLACVGRGCLQYQAERGAPPRDVEDVLRAGFLIRDSTGQFVDTRRGAHGWRVLSSDAVRVKLSFPSQTDEYELRGNVLVNKVTGQPHLLVDIDDATVWREHVRQANEALAADWLKVVRGEPLDDW